MKKIINEKIIKTVVKIFNIENIIWCSVIFFFMDSILKRKYNGILNISYMCWGFFLLCIIAKRIKNNNRLKRFLNLLLVIIIMIIPITTLICLPNFTVKNAAGIVRTQAEKELGMTVQREKYTVDKKISGGNLLVHYDYIIVLTTNSGDYLFKFDPFTGKYSKDN